MSPTTQSEFMKLVAAAVDRLPEWVRESMDNIDVLVDDEPPGDEPDELLGLYEGIPLTRRGDDYGGVLPDRITLFLGPIEREAAATGVPIGDVITRTLRHEVAHHFGIDDDRLFDIDAY
jgi:predicted Zn-dependent protease with MMP-like domain